MKGSDGHYKKVMPCEPDCGKPTRYQCQKS